MDLLEQWVLAVQALARGVALHAGGNRRIPWLVDLAAQAAIVAVLAWFAFPGVSFVAAPLLQVLAGPEALHYPAASRLLPLAIGRLEPWLAPLVWPVLLGWSAALGGAALYGRELGLGAALGDTLRRLPKLLVVGAPLAFLYAVAGRLGAGALATLHHGPLRALGTIMGDGLVETAVLTLAALALPVLVMRDEPLGFAPAHVEIAWRRSGVAAAGMGFVLAALGIVSRLALGIAGSRVTAGRPDLGPFIAVGMIVWAILGGMALCGGSLFVYALTREES